MSKRKYIKNSKGVTMSVTTDTLGLEKPLLNENYNIDVHNRNMDKIDEDLKPIDDSYIIELFQHDGDTTNPKDYYTKDEADLKYATKEDANIALDRANEAFQRGDNVKTQLVDKLISEGLNVSTNNTFEELIGNIALGKKWASGSVSDISLGDYDAITGYCWEFSVTGLSFKPSFVLAYIDAENIASRFERCFLYDKNSFGENYFVYHAIDKRRTYFDATKSTKYYINNDGFFLPFMYNTSNTSTVKYSIKWIAFE